MRVYVTVITERSQGRWQLNACQSRAQGLQTISQNLVPLKSPCYKSCLSRLASIPSAKCQAPSSKQCLNKVSGQAPWLGVPVEERLMVLWVDREGPGMDMAKPYSSGWGCILVSVRTHV